MMSKNTTSPKLATLPRNIDELRRRITSHPRLKTRILMVLCMSAFLAMSVAYSSDAENSTPSRSEIASRYGNTRVPFIVNKGQADERVIFYAETFGGTVFITSDGDIGYSLPKWENRHVARGVTLKERFVGGQCVSVEGTCPVPTRVNYFKGDDPAGWITALEAYSEVSMDEIYPGIDLSLVARGNNVEKLFTIQPGVDPSLITMHIEGATGLSVNDDGELVVETGSGPVMFTRPVAYQSPASAAGSGESPADRAEIAVAYVVNGSEYGFCLGEYDRDRAVIIDPLLASTFLGSSGTEWGFAIEFDVEGNVYIGCETSSSSFPTTPGVYGEQYQGGSRDAVISKLDASLSTLLASTVIGGNGHDAAYTIVLDPVGNVYLSGTTNSYDYPTTAGAYDRTHNGVFDAFVSKLDGDLTTLLASTYLGGSGDDYGHGLTLDADGNVFVGGETGSADFPASPGAYDGSHNGLGDAFVSRLDGNLSALQASTYVGGHDWESANSVVLSDSGDVFITGYVASSSYPTTPGSYDETYNGGNGDTFVSRLDSDLTTLIASTFLGGTGMDYSYGMTVGEGGNIVITGGAHASSFPTTPGAYDESFNGASDAYVAMLDDDLSTLLASTFLGGPGLDDGFAVVVDGEGSIYVAGAASSGYPTTSGAYDESFNGQTDVFITKLTESLTVVAASTFIGGSLEEGASSLASDGQGNVAVVGRTSSSNYPTSLTALDTSHNGSNDVYITILDGSLSVLPTAVYAHERPVFMLETCYPNPFNPHTTIAYTLPDLMATSLRIYDVSGRLVRTLQGGEILGRGRHKVVWNGRDEKGQEVSSGVYFCRLEAGPHAETRRMVLVR